MGHWETDLQFGNHYERIAAELLEDGDVVTPPPGVKHSAWDFLHNGTSYEVKADRRAKTTGNFAIEYEHSRVPSGVATSQADYWILFCVKANGYDAYRVPINALKGICDANNHKWHTDNGNSRFHLVAINKFSDYLWKQL